MNYLTFAVWMRFEQWLRRAAVCGVWSYGMHSRRELGYAVRQENDRKISFYPNNSLVGRCNLLLMFECQASCVDSIKGLYPCVLKVSFLSFVLI